MKASPVTHLDQYRQRPLQEVVVVDDEPRPAPGKKHEWSFSALYCWLKRWPKLPYGAMVFYTTLADLSLRGQGHEWVRRSREMLAKYHGNVHRNQILRWQKALETAGLLEVRYPVDNEWDSAEYRVMVPSWVRDSSAPYSQFEPLISAS
jgi:hypothetical protein